MNDSARLRSTPCRVRAVSACCPCYCMCPFSRTVRCARSHRTGLCQHAFPTGETSVRHRRMTGHTLSQPLRAAGLGSRATCSLLACMGTKVAPARWCQSLPRGPLRQRLPAESRTDHMPEVVVVALYTLRGLYSISPGGPRGWCSTWTVTHTITNEINSSPIKDSDESKQHVSTCDG